MERERAVSNLPAWAREARAKWHHTGRERPGFAVAPEPGQESAWDYPRPPRIEGDPRTVLVRHGDTIIARTNEAVRVLETGSPPTFYLPPDSVRTELLERASGSSRCEWKGKAAYWDVVLSRDRIPRAAWSYSDPFPGFEEIRGFFAFYPAHIQCFVGEERVRPQPGGFYGGWVTSELVGPFKGEPGSEHW